MAWTKATPKLVLESNRPAFTPAVVDWARLVTLDFETYWDADYTLSKMTTVEYVRDKRFEAQMVGLKIGERPTELVPYNRLKARLQRINWATHSVLCHHTQFDGFILWQRFGIIPKKYYCTLSMARAWLSNDIGAGLDEVARFLGHGGKLDDGAALYGMKGIRVKDMHPELYRKGGEYCMRDVELCYSIFREDLLQHFSQQEIDLIDLTIQMFCCPVLRLDENRARIAMETEIRERDELLESIAGSAVLPATLDNQGVRDITGKPGKGKLEIEALRAEITIKQAKIYVAKKTLGSNEKFADLLRAEGVDPPYKISPTWMKLTEGEQEARIADKYTYAFARDDLGFIGMMEDADTDRIRDLCEARIAVKSNSNITKAERLLRYGAGGQAVPAYYKYAAAHTWRFGGGDKTNFQNYKRGGELRACICAPADHVLIWGDSSQIEVRVNAWLWGQEDLLEDFRLGIDIYSKFGIDTIYGRHVGKDTPEERHVSKTAILGLGYGMGHEKFRNGLAQGKGGPRVIITEDFSQSVVRGYRKKFHKIAAGWKICDKIIADMASGVQGEYKCLRWEKEILWLPNGMRMKYPGLGWDDEAEAWTYTRKGAKVKIYGAKLNENIVQALARIIVASEQMLAISREVPVVMTTHDEVVICVPKSEARKRQDFMANLLIIPPDWCSDIPLDCETGAAYNYS